MGEKSMEIARVLTDECELPPAMSVALIQSVWSVKTVSGQGQGQGTRLKWFVAAIQERYRHKLDMIRHDPKQFKMFVADVEDVMLLRDTLKGEGLSISFHAAFLFWELGFTEEQLINVLYEDSLSNLPSGTKSRLLVKAAQLVKTGNYMTLESALDAMNYGYIHSARSY